MNLGANLEPIDSLSASKKAPGVPIAPAATRTPSTRFTFGSTAALKLGTSPVSWRTSSLAVITTSVFASESSKISSKAANVVSVGMYVPATKATPMTTASVVVRPRTLRAQRLLIAKRVKGLADLLHQLDHIRGRARHCVMNDMAV